MSKLEKVPQKPEKKRGGTSGLGNPPPPELAVNQQESEILCPLLDQMQKINETLIKMESVLISRQKQISETTRKMEEIAQKSNLTLRFQGVKEEEKEDLRSTSANVLAPLTGREAKELKEEVDMAFKAYPAFMKENNLPAEGVVELIKQYTRDPISCVVFAEPVKIGGQKYKDKDKREKIDSVFKAQKFLKRHASTEENAALAIWTDSSSEEDSSPGERGAGAGDTKAKKSPTYNLRDLKRRHLKK